MFSFLWVSHHAGSAPLKQRHRGRGRGLGTCDAELGFNRCWFFAASSLIVSFDVQNCFLKSSWAPTVPNRCQNTSCLHSPLVADSFSHSGIFIPCAYSSLWGFRTARAAVTNKHCSNLANSGWFMEKAVKYDFNNGYKWPGRRLFKEKGTECLGRSVCY